MGVKGQHGDGLRDGWAARGQHLPGKPAGSNPARLQPATWGNGLRTMGRSLTSVRRPGVCFDIAALGVKSEGANRTVMGYRWGWRASENAAGARESQGSVIAQRWATGPRGHLPADLPSSRALSRLPPLKEGSGVPPPPAPPLLPPSSLHWGLIPLPSSNGRRVTHSFLDALKTWENKTTITATAIMKMTTNLN